MLNLSETASLGAGLESFAFEQTAASRQYVFGSHPIAQECRKEMNF
jgi:hypothetical protein